jgi:hypothetical protein
MSRLKKRFNTMTIKSSIRGCFLIESHNTLENGQVYNSYFADTPTGIKIISSCVQQAKEVWQFLAKEVLKQQCYLGVKIG